MSPAFSENSAANNVKNQTQNRFNFAETINEEFFFESSPSLPGETNDFNFKEPDFKDQETEECSCACKKIAKMSLSLNLGFLKD